MVLEPVVDEGAIMTAEEALSDVTPSMGGTLSVLSSRGVSCSGARAGGGRVEVVESVIVDVDVRDGVGRRWGEVVEGCVLVVLVMEGLMPRAEARACESNDGPACLGGRTGLRDFLSRAAPW